MVKIINLVSSTRTLHQPKFNWLLYWLLCNVSAANFKFLHLSRLDYSIYLDIFLHRLKLDSHKANIYSAIVTVVTIYMLLVIYCVYYYYEDFKKVFCKKKTLVKQE
jgi:hypothetical protein